MRLAWQTAAQAGGFDHYLWLNDDVELDPGALARLLDEAEAHAAGDGAVVACGSTREPGGAEMTYGGQRRTHPRRPLRFALVAPGATPVPVDTVSGNVVLVSAGAFARLGNLAPDFVHIFGDLDYALRARAAGIPVIAGSGWSGTCEGADVRGTSLDPALGRWRRLQRRLGEEGQTHVRDWRVLARRHSGLGPLSVAYALVPYWRILRDR